MDKKFEDTKISIGKSAWLEIKEVRGSSTMYSRKEGYEEVSKDTHTHFHWKIRALTSKFDADTVSSDDFDRKDQEVYNIGITSDAYDIGHYSGFKSKEDAIRNALAFAKRNGMELDGFELPLPQGEGIPNSQRLL